MSDSKTNSDLGAIFATWILRLWLGLRAVITGIEKYSGHATTSTAINIDGSENAYGLVETSSEKSYSFDFYQGIPTGLYDKFSNEPLIPEFLLPLFDKMIGPAFIISGLALLLGIATRCSLFVMGLLYIGLTLGLILINQSSGVAWLGIHAILVVMMLHTSQHNKFELTGRWKI